MATVYQVKLVSHWINYPEEQLAKILEDAIKEKEREKGNAIQIDVVRE
jgi:hypothetical protein